MIVSLCVATPESSEPTFNIGAEPTDHYLRTFNWNKVRYRTDRPLGELIENLTKVGGENLSLGFPGTKWQMLTLRV